MTQVVVRWPSWTDAVAPLPSTGKVNTLGRPRALRQRIETWLRHNPIEARRLTNKEVGKLLDAHERTVERAKQSMRANRACQNSPTEPTE
jgi:hypothetical protein